MTRLSERTGRRAGGRAGRPEPDEVVLADARPGSARIGAVLRVLGALAVLATGAVHLEQYFAVHVEVIPVIGPLFVLNFDGATLIGLGLLLPLGRLHVLPARAGIGPGSCAPVSGSGRR